MRLVAETWKAVPGYDQYEVSDRGQVRRKDGFTSDGHRHKGRVLKRVLNQGRWELNLCKDGKVRLFHSYVLVLLAFRGPCPPGFEARHVDDDSSNDKLSNIYWGTHSENMRDACINGRLPTKLKPSDVLEIKQSKASDKDLGKKFGVTFKMVRLIRRGKARRHG